jgi:hypothetical protein
MEDTDPQCEFALDILASQPTTRQFPEKEDQIVRWSSTCYQVSLPIAEPATKRT